MSIQDPSRGEPPLMLAYGFRPFFLGAVAWAILAMLAWMAAYAGRSILPTGLSPMLWHGHEMLFGFVGASLGGFLLTAVPNWTNTPPVTGGRLGLAVAAWLLGRIVLLAVDGLPYGVVVAVDLLFLPILAVLVGQPIVATGNRRNYPFPLLLLTMAVGNLLIHLDGLGVADLTWPGLLLSTHAVTAMIILVGGRIVPNFTANAIRMQGLEPTVRMVPWIEKGWWLAWGVAVAGDLSGMAPVAGAGTLALGVLMGLRMRGWQTGMVLKQPILWVLHLGHGWLVVALLVKGLADLSGVVPTTLVLHALFIGAFTTMIIAVASRAALGHTGRPLLVARPVILVYGLVSLTAVLRVVLPWLNPERQILWVHAAGGVWLLAFVLFALVYLPILTRPRVDGKPG